MARLYLLKIECRYGFSLHVDSVNKCKRNGLTLSYLPAIQDVRETISTQRKIES